MRGKIFNLENFVKLAQTMIDKIERYKKIGTHSISNLTATFTRSSRDQLCIGSAIKCELKKECGIDDDWVCQHVVHFLEKFGNRRETNILAKTILWTFLDRDSQYIDFLCLVAS